MKELLIASAVFCASVITFYSGFGLGTMLMPILALFFPVTIAIALTACIHLLNNILKLCALWRDINWNITIRFGIPALVAAVFGALLLTHLQHGATLFSYSLFGVSATVTPVKLIVGALLIFFATLDVFPQLRQRVFTLTLPLSGVLSGFFGGLSGHQGAFRSAFLINTDLNKHQFIATSAAISSVVDVTRLTVYGLNMAALFQFIEIRLAIAIIVSSLAGIAVGKMYLQHATLAFIRGIIAIMLYVFGLLLVMGIM